MAVTVRIVTTSDFVGRADLTQNVDANKMLAHIDPVQEIFGIKILCNDFYDEVLAVVDGTATSAVITTLLPFIRDFLVYKTYAEYLIGAGLMSTAEGLRVSTSEVSEQASPQQMAAVVAQAEGWANDYQDRLVNFLSLNADDYPTWRDSICGGCSDRRVLANNQFSLVGGNRPETRIDFT